MPDNFGNDEFGKSPGNWATGYLPLGLEKTIPPTQAPVQPFGENLTRPAPDFAEMVNNWLQLGPQYQTQQYLNKPDEEKMKDMAQLAMYALPGPKVAGPLKWEISRPEFRKGLQKAFMGWASDAMTKGQPFEYVQRIGAQARRLAKEIPDTVLEAIQKFDVKALPGGTRGQWWDLTPAPAGVQRKGGVMEIAPDFYSGHSLSGTATHEVGHTIEQLLREKGIEDKYLRTSVGKWSNEFSGISGKLHRMREGALAMAETARNQGNVELGNKLREYSERVYGVHPREIFARRVDLYRNVSGDTLQEASKKAARDVYHHLEWLKQSKSSNPDLLQKQFDELKKEYSKWYWSGNKPLLISGKATVVGQTPQGIIEKQGLKYDNMVDYTKDFPNFGKVHYFTDPKTGSSLAMKEGFTEQELLDKLNESRGKFGVK